MKVVHKGQRKEFKNGKYCVSFEYPLNDTDINGAVIELKGRYPEKGRVVNLKCKEMAYIISGFGKLMVEGKEVKLSEGDLAFIAPGEKYFWEGKMTMFVPCVPAWYPKQHKETD